MARYQRRQTPKVQNGKVQRKNRTDLSPGFRNKPQDVLTIERERPGDGYQHLLKKAQVGRFIALLPTWEKLAWKLEAIVLAPGESGRRGWHSLEAVGICAWPRSIEVEWRSEYVDRHRVVLDRLHVPVERVPGAACQLGFTRSTARAFQLISVLLEQLVLRYDHAAQRFAGGQMGPSGSGAKYLREHADAVWDACRVEFKL